MMLYTHMYDMSDIEGGSEEEWVRADRRPQTSQPWLQQRSGASSVTQSTKRKTEVFVVRTRQRRKGRDEEKDFGARRERYEGRSKIREGREVRDGEGEVKVDGRNPGRRRRRKQRDREHDKEKEGELKVAGGRQRCGERGERDEGNSSGNPNRGERCKAGLKKREGEVEQEEGTASKRQDENRDQVTKTNSCQRYDRSREKPCDSVDKDQRERGRRDTKGMESWQEEATRVQSDKLNLGERELVKSRNRAKREKRELQGMQRRDKEQSIENGVHAEQDNSNAEGIGLKRTQDERVDRNWRLESKEKEPPLLSSAEKEEKVVPDQERGERRSKKCGSMPKKAKNGNTSTKLEPAYSLGLRYLYEATSVPLSPSSVPPPLPLPSLSPFLPFLSPLFPPPSPLSSPSPPPSLIYVYLSQSSHSHSTKQ